MIRALVVAAALVAGAGCGRPTSHDATAANSGAVARHDPIRVAMLVQKRQHLQLALRTGAEMLAGRTLPAKAVTVIVCGDEVGSLRTGSELEPELVAARSAGVRIAACGISLERSGIGQQELSSAVEVVPNGLVEVLRLQRDGYLSVEP